MNKPLKAEQLFFHINHMFKTTFIAFVPVMIFSSLAHSQALETPPEQAYLNIRTSRAGYETLVNGVSIGRTPIIDHPVAPGKIEIIIRRRDDQSWTAPDWTKKMTAAAGDTLHVLAEIQRHYMIRSKPFGAQILSGGLEIGKTPFIYSIPDTATRILRIAKSGYVAIDLICSPEARNLRTVELESKDDFREAQIVQLQEKLRLRKMSRKRKAFVMAGVSFVSALSAILLKQKADNLYDEYNLTATPGRANALFNRTKRFDRYAGASYGVFQVSFGVGFYFFLKSQ